LDLSDFRSLIERLKSDIPAEFQAGVVDVEVSHKTVPHPVRGDVFTLGECIPLDWSGAGADLKSRVILYHGSFQALARLGEFDWRTEAWETLTHELRHHLEWQADLAALEAYDWAAEQNFARIEGEAFDPVFYRNGEQLAPGIYKVDDDVFLEHRSGAAAGRERIEIAWHGRRYDVPRPQTPRDTRTWVFVTLQGLADPPPGDVVLVLPGGASLFDLFRTVQAPVQQSVQVRSRDG